MLGTGQTSQSLRRSELCVFRATHVEARPVIPDKTCVLITSFLHCAPQPAKKKAKKEESEEEAVASAEEQHYSEAEAEEDAKPAPKKRKVRPPASGGASVHNCGISLTRFDTPICLDRLPRRPRRRSLLRTLTRPRRRRSLLTRSPQRRKRRWVPIAIALLEEARVCVSSRTDAQIRLQHRLPRPRLRALESPPEAARSRMRKLRRMTMSRLAGRQVLSSCDLSASKTRKTKAQTRVRMQETKNTKNDGCCWTRSSGGSLETASKQEGRREIARH